MPQDPAHYLNPLESHADFTNSITVKEIKIQDTGKGKKSVADDLRAVLRKIEGWHQGSITGFIISYRDTQGDWHRISWDGKEATEKEVSQNIEDQNLRLLPQAQAADRILPATRFCGWPLSALQGLLC